MDAKIGQFFSGSDKIPRCDGVVIAGCERKVREATDAVSEEVKKKCLMRLSWALVHSRQTGDVQRGIAMLEDGVITATAFGFIAGVIVAALARKK